MTFLLAISSLLSRLIGVYRNHELASAFGASGLSDAYFAAFQIPDTLYRLFVFGAISASFVPLFLALRKKDSEEAWVFVSTLLNFFLLITGIFSLLIIVFAEPCVRLLYPDLTPDLQGTTAQLLRIMMLSPLLFTLSSVFSGVQNAFRTFWGFALAPIVYNLGILSGIWWLAPSYGIAGVAYGVVVGAFLHAAVQLLPCLKLGMHWRPTLVWSESFRKIFVLAVPRVLTMAGFQINFFIEGLIATTIAVGNLTVLRYAQDIQSFPIGIIGVSVAISSFSILSGLVIDEKKEELASYLKRKLDHLLMLMIPAAFGLFLLRYPLVELILGAGQFDAAAVQLTADSLGYLCFGILAAAITPLISRAFFAFHDTLYPFVITLFTVVINTILAYQFATSWGIIGIAVASSISSTLSVLAMMVVLKLRYFRKNSYLSWDHLLIFLIASGVMSGLLQQIIARVSFSHQWWMLTAEIILLSAAGAAIYGAVLFVFLRRDFLKLLRGLND